MSWWGSNEVVEGIVDTFSFDHILGRAEFIGGIGEAQKLELMRRRFQTGKTGSKLVVRPRLCKEPWEHYAISAGLRGASRLKVGQAVSFRARKIKPPANAIAEASMYLGEMVEIVSINDLEPTTLPSVCWQEVEGIISDQPLLRGRLGRILTLTGAAPTIGDCVILAGEPESGKSNFLVELATEAAASGQRVVYALVGEREKDILRAQAAFKDISRLVFFGVAGTQSALRKLRTVELAAHHAVSRAEQSEQVVLILDSGTKGLAGPIIDNLPPPDGVGIQKGGLNPLARDALTVIWGLAKATTSGSLTIVTSFLDREPLDTTLINSGRDTGDGIITLSYAARSSGIYPPLMLGREKTWQDGRERWFARTSSRTQRNWCAIDLMQAAGGLSEMLSPDTCSQAEAEKAAAAREHVDRQVLAQRGIETAIGRLKRLINLVDTNADDSAIWRDFRIAPPGGLSTKKLLAPAKPAAETPASEPLVAPIAKTAIPATPANGNSKTEVGTVTEPASLPEGDVTTEAALRLFGQRGPYDP